MDTYYSLKRTFMTSASQILLKISWFCLRMNSKNKIQEKFKITQIELCSLIIMK